MRETLHCYGTVHPPPNPPALSVCLIRSISRSHFRLVSRQQRAQRPPTSPLTEIWVLVLLSEKVVGYIHGLCVSLSLSFCATVVGLA